MPRPVIVLRPALAAATLCDRPLVDVLLDTLVAAGADRDGPTDGPAVVLDSRYAAVSAHALAGLVAGASEGGVLLAGPNVIAVARPSLPEVGERTDDQALLTMGPGKRHLLPPAEVLAADDAWELARIERTRMGRALRALGRAGVRIMDPSRVFLGDGVVVEPGALIWPDVVLRGNTRIAAGAEVQSGAWLVDTTVEDGAVIKPHTVCEGAVVGRGASVGPMAHLRPGSVLGRGVKVGNFVEVKKTTLADGAKASHLSYLGDARIGPDANIGAGTITCNYDGFGKHRTDIGAGAFIGSNTALVAPVTVGAGAIVGAGAVIAQAGADQALAVDRAAQRTLQGKAPAIRERSLRRAESEDG